MTSINDDIFEDCANLASVTFDCATTEIALLLERRTVNSLPNPKVIGYKNSTAEEYAKKRNLVFEVKPITVTVNGTPLFSISHQSFSRAGQWCPCGYF